MQSTINSRFHDFPNNDAQVKIQDMLKMNAYANIKLQSKDRSNNSQDLPPYT